MRLVFWIGFWVFLLDQVSKYIVVHVMELDRVTRIEVWPPFVNFHMAWNTGVNFGLMAGNGDIMRWVLIAVALGICGFVLYWIRRDRPGLNGVDLGRAFDWRRAGQCRGSSDLRGCGRLFERDLLRFEQPICL